MSSLNKDARGFVDGVVSYFSHGGKSSVGPKVVSLLNKVTSQAKNEKSAHISSSVALTGEEKTRLERFLARVLGHVVDVQYGIDASLLGGIRIQVADWIVDTSLKSQLHEMKSTLGIDV